MKNKKIREQNRRDLAVLIILPAVAAFLCWTLDLDFLVSTILFFGSPAAYLSWRGPRRVRRALIFAGCFAIAGTYTDYMAEKDLAWYEPSSVFRFRIGGVVPVESVVWFLLLTYLVILFYEHFFDGSTHKPTGHRMKLMYALLLVASIAFIVPLSMGVRLPIVSYFYLKLGLLLGGLPLLAFCIEFPRFLRIFIKTAPYFFAVSLLNELVGLHNGHWVFPGRQFIGWVHMGSFSFPFEELLFWMVMFSSIVVTYFEFFDDNRLKFPAHALLHRSSK